MTRFLIVGSGYRSEYYARIAIKHPDLFEAMFLCRSKEKCASVTRATGVPAVCSEAEALAFRPDFAVVAVDREHVADVSLLWAEKGFPVLAETPVGSSEEKLRALWDCHLKTGARISCAEQYCRHPFIARGLDLVARGVIGEPVSAYLSLAHDYHGFSLLARLLGVRGEPYVVRALRTGTKVAATDSRYGAILDGSVTEEKRDQAHILFGSGKTAIYDFAPTQYRTFIRDRHLSVRGTRGEWSDRTIRCLNGSNEPERIFLTSELSAAHRALDTQTLRDLRRTFTPEIHLETEWDEYAIGTMLMDMGNYASGGPTPYPLRDALADAHFWLTLNKAAAHPFEPVPSGEMPWDVQ